MAKVKPIPEGLHTLTPYLVVRGAAEAIAFYKKAFGAAELSRMPMSDGKLIGHAHLKIGDSNLFLSDEMPGMGGKAPPPGGGGPVGLHLYVEDVDAAFQRAVAAGCTAKMPPMDMFWGDRFAKLTDPFGHDWSMATHKEDLSPEEMKKRGEAAMAEFNKHKQG
jgi:uncharacterized glyoxalase superfamily protein PhnB